MMEIDEYGAFAEKCFRDTLPPCTVVCPLGVDVRGIVDKIQRNNFTSAYRLYRNQVLFPGIVSQICERPCKEACVRGRVDQSIMLRELEAACVAYTKDAEPIQYNVPKKNHTIAIVGAGLCGLSCALKLASRNYTVTVYEAKENIGGRLAALLDAGQYLPEIESQLSCVDYTLHRNTPVKDLEKISADVLFIATGQNGENFGLSEGTNRKSLATMRKGVFLGGNLLETTPIVSIAQGIRASYSIEAFLKVGTMDGVPETFTERTIVPEYYTQPIREQFPPVDGSAALEREEAVTEGKRCLRCNCAQCYNNCELMQCFNAYPQKITKDIMPTLRPIEKLTGRIASRLINSCMLCGVCGDVCPESIDMEHCLLEARRHLHRDGALPSAYHDFWLRDMNFSNTEAFLSYVPKPHLQCDYMFFPGCQLGASDPAYVTRTYDHILKTYENTSLLLACCGVPADWSGDPGLRDSVLAMVREQWEKQGKPVILLACPTCRKTFSRHFSDAETRSLYELFAEIQLPEPKKVDSGGTVHIYDPCASRADSVMQRSVRDLAQHVGLTIEELEMAFDGARCCGVGGHIYAVNKEMVQKVVDQRIAAGDKEYVTYCTNCRDIFASSGKACRHILDVLLTDNPADRVPPSLTQRRANRIAVKRAFAEKAGILMPEVLPDEEYVVHISEDLTRKMNSLLILEEEVRAVVAHCENTGDKLLQPKTGNFIGHLQLGIITYWVEYAVQDSGIILHNVYTHRLSIEE